MLIIVRVFYTLSLIPTDSQTHRERLPMPARVPAPHNTRDEIIVAAIPGYSCVSVRYGHTASEHRPPRE
jgi:hypothetical protein